MAIYPQSYYDHLREKDEPVRVRKAIITVGISASGKTTWANDKWSDEFPEWQLVSRDDIRMTILENQLGRDIAPNELWNLWEFNAANEKEVTDMYWGSVWKAYEMGFNVILHDTNLSHKRNQEMVKTLFEIGFEHIEYKEFPVDLIEAVNRDRKRDKSVGARVIHQQYAKWNEYQKEKVIS